MASIVEHNAYLSNGDVFVGAIDIKGEREDAQYIYNALVGYIENV
jgi:hypothetical protein